MIKIYNFRCSACGNETEEVLDLDKEELPLCESCGISMNRVPSAPLIGMSFEQRDRALRKRSHDDNVKHQDDRVAKVLERMEKGSMGRGSVFDPQVQARIMEKKKKNR